MSDLAPRLRPKVSFAGNLPYARMILRTPAMRINGWPVITHSNPAVTKKMGLVERPIAENRSRGQFQPAQGEAADRFALFGFVAADVLMLAAACLLPALMSITWSLPWLAMPAFTALVTLLIFSEGLYREPMGATSGEFQALARAVLFAMALILAAAWKDIQPLAAIFTTATSLIALMVWRRFAVWQQKRGRPVSRNVLIVGCGPAGRAIAQALREDPLHLTTV